MVLIFPIFTKYIQKEYYFGNSQKQVSQNSSNPGLRENNSREIQKKTFVHEF